MKNILHISDLHLSITNGKGFQTSNIDTLLSSLIKSFPNEANNKIDTIFITGDISFSGAEKEFIGARKLFIEPLIQQLNLTLDDLYMVPGNHDISREKFNTLQRSFRNNSSETDLNEFCIFVEKETEEWEQLDNYNEFKKNIIKEQKNVDFDSPLITVRSPSKNLRIHCLNSAWLAGDDNDKGKLRLLTIITRSIKKYGKNKNNIVLIHHPTDWFHSEEQNLISRELEKHVDALFFGHMHQFEQSITINFSQDITLRLQAGTLDTRNKNSGYSIVRLHSKNNFNYGSVLYKKYDFDHQKYVPWTERAENGVSDFSLDGNAQFDSLKFSNLSRSLCEKIQYSHIINTGKELVERRKLCDIFIEPNFHKDQGVIEINPDIRSVTHFNDLIDPTGCILISGTEQDGKTTLLKRIEIDYLERQASTDLQKIIFYINLNIEYSHKSKILKSFLSVYSTHDLHTSFDAKIKSSIKDGNAVFLVDNYDKANQVTAKAIDDFISENSNNTFILTCASSDSANSIKRLIPIFPKQVSHASIGTIERKDIRKIISLRPNLSHNCSEDEIYHNVIKIVDNSQLPHNHFVYSILLAIYETNNTLVGILSEADVIENFIEVLLHKHCMEIKVNKPTYKVMIHFMGFVASKMLRMQKLSLDKTEYLQLAIEFEKLTFNKFELDNYFKPVVESGIIIFNKNSTLEFSNECFLYFFSAYYMNIDISLREFIFSNDNYLHLDKVVEYYSARNSSSFDVLSFFENKILKLKENISDVIQKEHGIDINSLDLNEMSDISFLDIASTNEDFEEKINELKSDTESYDYNLDINLPLKNEKNNSDVIHGLDKDYMPHKSNLDITLRFKKELSLFSKVFRNTELLMDPNRVLQIFDLIVNSYVFQIKADVARLDENVVLPLLMPLIEDKLNDADISQENKIKGIDSIKVILSIIRASIPNVVEYMMSSDLATKKPRFKNILKTKLLSLNNESDSAVEMLLRFLLLEVERQDFQCQIKDLLKCSGKFTSNTLFLKLIQLLNSRHDFSVKDKEYLRNTIKILIATNKEIGVNEFKGFVKVLRTESLLIH